MKETLDPVHMKVVGNVAYISLNVTRFDADSSGAIKRAIDAEFDPSIKQAEVDIGKVQFIDSSGIGVLLGIYRKLPHEDSRVTLHNVKDSILAVLELLRLQRIFTID